MANKDLNACANINIFVAMLILTFCASKKL